MVQAMDSGGIETDDLTTVIDPLSDGLAVLRAWHNDRRVAVIAQQEPVGAAVRRIRGRILLILVEPDDLPAVVDPEEPGSLRVRAGRVEGGGEVPLVPDEAVA